MWRIMLILSDIKGGLVQKRFQLSSKGKVGG